MSANLKIKDVSVIDQFFGENWAAYHGDSCEIIRGIPTDSIHYQILSPPFESLYTYSASDRDLGNSADSETFWEHYKFLISEQFRVCMPGRLVSIHAMNLPTSKTRDGVIGLRDFRGEIIRSHQEAGFIYHSEVVIWKDPVTAMQRTKALGLLHKQLKKDSCMSRQGIHDYLVTMRKPGDNPERVTHTNESFPVSQWQHVASPTWTYGENDPIWKQVLDWILQYFRPLNAIPIPDRFADPVWYDINPSNTLQKTSAREHSDERHIAPLQLEVIERAINLWTNPGDVVLSPFGGIGSEGYIALKNNRKAILMELKASYFKQLVANLTAASSSQLGLLDFSNTQN